MPAAERPPLVSGNRDDTLALSYVQQSLWLLDSLDPDNRPRNVASAHRIRGPLDIEALRHAFEAIVARHEALRTVFPATEGVPRQQVLAPGHFELPIDDLTAVPAAEREPEVARRLERAELIRFDLAAGPLVAARVLRIAEAEHVLLITVHHIVTDGLSMTVMWRELGELYGASSRGASPSLPPVPIQYADYAQWLRGWLTADKLDEQVGYWTRHLEDAPADLPLPYKGPRPATQTFRVGRVALALEPELATALRDLGHRHGATVFIVVLGALRALLARYCGQRDMCIGTTTANRDHHLLERLIGSFANTVVLRGHVDRNDRFTDLLVREREIVLSALAHQDAPFDQVVKALHIERSVNRMPLLQVMCDYQNEIGSVETLPGLTVEPVHRDHGGSPWDLSVSVRDGARIELGVDYNVDLFDHATTVDLLARLVRLFTAIVGNPEAPLSGIELLDADERATLLDEPAIHVSWEPAATTLVDRIEHSMREHADKPALLWLGGAMTYRELDASSARLAAALRRAGVGADRTVAVIAERGRPQIVGLVAILRAGGAYVPIKTDTVGERTLGILDEAAPLVVLCDGPLPDGLARYRDKVIGLDDPDSWPAGPAGVAQPVPDDSLAYVIYTSGSTGQPKGIMVTRHGLDAQLQWNQDEYPLTSDDRCLQLHSFTFDASVPEIFCPLAVGGAIVQPRPLGELEPQHLDELIAETRTTMVRAVPSMMWALLEATDASKWSSVKWIELGGEALSIDLARRCMRAFPQSALYNAYGPTEITVNATFWRCADDGKRVPIGRPVTNTTAYVLDDNLAPVPPGGIGELWLGGAQLARGYLGRPALTAERFVPDPFTTRPGARLYRSGDLVRQRRDGALEYVGRSDFQVKVRGFRIELGEIEAILHQHPHVRTAVVRAHDRGRNKVLVAHVCLSGPASLVELQRFAADRLPPYMVPSSIAILDELPLTTSGKLDVKALPALEDEDHDDDYVAPRTPTETALADLWCEVLGVERVGIRDDFFDLGGDSLLAVELIAKIARRLGADVPVAKLFDAPTIADLAEHVDGSRGEARRDTPQRLSLAEGPLGLLQPYWIAVHYANPGIGSPLLVWNCWRLRGSLDLSALERAVAAVGVRHEILRTSYVRADGAIRQIVRPARAPFLPSYEYEDVSAHDAHDDADRERALASAIRRLTDRSIEVESGPVATVKLIRIAPDDHMLVRHVHHAVFDGPSYILFNQDLAEAYRAALAAPMAESTALLPDLPIQVLDVVTFLSAYKDSPAGRSDIDYWTTRFDGLPPLELPLDFPRDALEAERAARHVETGHPYVAFSPSAVLQPDPDETLGEAVTSTARREGVPLLPFFLASFAELLHAATGQTDLAIQTTINLRPILELQPLIGPFNGPIFVRFDLAGRRSHRELMRQALDGFAAAYSHALIHPVHVVAPHAGRASLGFSPPGIADDFRLGDATGTLVPEPGMPQIPFDLRSDVQVDRGRLSFRLTYNTRLFRRETIERLAARYFEILRAMATDPDGTI
jgi:amino acid adenylation domain-containing protein